MKLGPSPITYYCTLRLETDANFTGSVSESFLAWDWKCNRGILTITLMGGKKRIVNFNKVLWFDSEVYEASE